MSSLSPSAPQPGPSLSCYECTKETNHVPHFGFFRHRQKPNLRDTGWATDRQKYPLILLAPATDDIRHQFYTVPWEKKVPKLFFRGGPYCHTLESPYVDWSFVERALPHWRQCSRALFFNVSGFFPGFAHLADCAMRGGTPKTGRGGLGASYVLDKDQGSADFVSVPDHSKFRFLLALDGLTVSQRFSKLFFTNSVVFKEVSAWEEFFYDALHPWVHYVPILNRSATVCAAAVVSVIVIHAISRCVRCACA